MACDFFKDWQSLLFAKPVLAALAIGAMRFVYWIMFKKKRHLCLAGKTVLVTGASSGLGKALSLVFYSRGCRVILAARSIDRLRAVCEEIKLCVGELKHAPSQLYEPLYRYLDLADTSSIQTSLQDILKICDGKLDILVNNAGISYRGSIDDTRMDVHRQLMDINYFGHIEVTRALLPVFEKQQEGYIVAVGSVQSKLSIPFRSAYSASKHAFQAFFDCLRAEQAVKNIHVMVALPGYIATNLSVNALTGSGDRYSILDETTKQGYSSSEVAVSIANALENLENEVLLADLRSKTAMLFRNWFPDAFFWLMEKRAIKAQKMK